MTPIFQRAERTQAKLRLAIDGPSGSGKTYSALLIAKGLASGDLAKVALIDSERGSGSLYADLGAYAVLDFGPPYTVKRFVEAHDAAVAEGYEVIVIDSLTHFWSGEGGILDAVDKFAAASTSGNTFAAWKKGTPLQKQLMDTMLGSPAHIIATIRSKTEWVIEENEKGKKVPRKVGLAPDQRKDIDYEYTIVLDLSREHIAQASKDRTGLFDERLEVPTEKMGAELLAWLGSAAPERPQPPRAVLHDEQVEQASAGGPDNGHITKTQARDLHNMLESKGRSSLWFLERLAAKNVGDGQHLTSLPADQYDQFLAIIRAFPDPEPPAPVAKAPEDAQEAESGAPAPPASEEAEALSEAENAFLEETAGNGKPAATPEPSGKKGTITPQQLTRLGALCSDLEGLGVGRDQWRLRMFEMESVQLKEGLTKTAATRVIDDFIKWHTDQATMGTRVAS